jgi:hypothetical protein
MGSAAEFNALCEFLTEKKVVLDGLVDSVFKGLENAEEAFDKMKNASQLGRLLKFRHLLLGKLVISVSRDSNSKL